MLLSTRNGNVLCPIALSSRRALVEFSTEFPREFFRGHGQARIYLVQGESQHKDFSRDSFGDCATRNPDRP
jgi:hypothetical protein